MEEALFYGLAAAALVAAANVVLRRNPVISTVNLVVVFFCLAGIYLILGFPLIAAVQLLVYAGAILVLFLFVMLLLNLRREEERAPAHRLLLGPLTAFAIGVLASAASLFWGSEKNLASPAASQDGAETLGRELFTTYLIPFEATGALLLAAIVGVVLLSRRGQGGAR